MLTKKQLREILDKFLYYKAFVLPKMLIGIKGRMQNRVVENDGEKKYLIEIIAEKVTFLSSKKEESE